MLIQDDLDIYYFKHSVMIEFSYWGEILPSDDHYSKWLLLCFSTKGAHQNYLLHIDPSTN